MNPRYLTAKELSVEIPFSEAYIRAAMNHPDFETIGNCPAYATPENARRFFKRNPGFRKRQIYKSR